MYNNPTNIYDAPFIIRVYPPAEKNTEDSPVVMIHGWTGNEHSTSVFHNAVPKNSFIIAPRGIIRIDEDRYGWVDLQSSSDRSFSAYKEVGNRLLPKIRNIILSEYPDQNKKMNMLGFSQGAAMAAVLVCLAPEMFQKIALLSGFLPPENPVFSSDHLSGIKFFIAHGKNDSLVKFEKALQLNQKMRDFGGDVKFCEEDIGHKVGASCMLSLRKFFS